MSFGKNKNPICFFFGVLALSLHAIMIALVLATICAAMFSIFFKIFQIKGIDGMKAIMVNYLTAFILGWLLSMKGSGLVNPFHERWFPLALVLGLIFIRGLVLLNISTEKIGVALSTVCSRASMIIPIVFCYLFIPGSKKPDWLAIVVVLAGLVMIICTDMRSVVGGEGKRSRTILLALAVFLIFGASNALLKLMQHNMSVTYGPQGEDVVSAMNAMGTSVIFITAFLICLVTELFKSLKSRKDNKKNNPFTWQTLLGGIGLGSANFFCTYLLVVSMRSVDSAILFPFHNAGIVAIGALVGWIAFGEKLKAVQIAGMILATIAIVWLCI